MNKQRCFIKNWLSQTFEPGSITHIEWANDSRCTITDTQGDVLKVYFMGRTLMADNKAVARMKSPREVYGQ